MSVFFGQPYSTMTVLGIVLGIMVIKLMISGLATIFLAALWVFTFFFTPEFFLKKLYFHIM